MKRWLFLLLLVLGFAPSAQAQVACPVDLLGEISALVEAQTAAQAGDSAEAVARIAEVQAQLDVILAACDQSSILPQVLRLPDGLFRIGYPADWSSQSPVGGVYILSNSTDASAIIADSNLGEAIPSGSQVVIVLYGSAESLFSVDDFDAFRRLVEEEGLNSEAQFTRPEAISRNEVAGVRYNVESDILEGTAYAFDLRGGKIAFLIGLSPLGEFTDLEPLFEAMVSSMDVGIQETGGTNAQPAPIIAVEPGVPLSELAYAEALPVEQFGEQLNAQMPIHPQTAVIAPDGSRIAWLDSAQLCTVAIADGSLRCIDVPESFEGFPSHLLWSPDSRYVAFSEEWTRTLRDPDLWVWDTTNGQLTNRTDDRFRRLPFGDTPDESEGSGPLWLEQVYAWGADGNLYFVRQEIPDVTHRDINSTALYRLSPESGAPEQIRLLSGLFENRSIYEMFERSLNGSLAPSPDVSQIAVLVRERDPDSRNSGVWIMSLADDAPPRQVITVEDLNAGMLRGAERAMTPMGVAWKSDGMGLFIYSSFLPATDSPSRRTMLHYYDLASGGLTPLTDLSDYSEDQLNEVVDGSDYTLRYFMPVSAVLTPDGSAVLALHINFEADAPLLGLWAYRLSEGGAERTLLLENALQTSLPFLQTPSIARDGTAMMFNSIWIGE
jgi:hypothetical protein